MEHFIRLLCISLCIFSLFGCTAISTQTVPTKTQKVIQKAEQDAFVVSRVSTDTFLITTISKNTDPDNPYIHAYIEGDGNSWKTRYQLSDNPTPKQPLALKLALKDPHPNVVYIARPCQYTPVCEDKMCDPKFWSSHRYAPEVITAVSEVLDRYARHSCESRNLSLGPRFRGDDAEPIRDDAEPIRDDAEPIRDDAEQNENAARQFILIGFSGGASVAALVASQRNDIVHLVTVAGDLNHVVLNNYHGTTPLHGSLNPADRLDNIRNIPQTHLCGTKDFVVPCWTVEAHCEACQNPETVRCNAIKGASHHRKWEKAWSVLLAEMLDSL